MAGGRPPLPERGGRSHIVWLSEASGHVRQPVEWACRRAGRGSVRCVARGGPGCVSGSTRLCIETVRASPLNRSRSVFVWFGHLGQVLVPAGHFGAVIARPYGELPVCARAERK